MELCLELDPAKRITAAEALAHPWIVTEGEARDAPLHTAVAALRQFNADQMFKQAAVGLMGSLSNAKEIESLKELFAMADQDKNGFLSQEEFGHVISQTGFDISPQTLMAAVDINGDGKLDLKEFLAATIQKKVYLKSANLKTVFKHLDSDGNVLSIVTRCSLDLANLGVPTSIRCSMKLI